MSCYPHFVEIKNMQNTQNLIILHLHMNSHLVKTGPVVKLIINKMGISLRDIYIYKMEFEK